MSPIPGILYLVATPIGNLKDITLRALDILKSVDCVVCEDTRRTGLLLSHFEIKKPLKSFHDHSPPERCTEIIRELANGKSAALVSDAGTPLISDPGFPLVREAIRQGIPVESIPGPCAFVSALILSGFRTEPFAFFGYLPQKESKRKGLLESLVNEEKTLVFYESPYRLLKALKNIGDIFGDRRVAVFRELTKKFEEIVRGTSEEAAKHFEVKSIKGELVVIVEGKF